MARQYDATIVVSGLDESGRGGLFAFDGSGLTRLDSLSTTGLAAGPDHVGRLLHAAGGYDSTTELLVYDQRGVALYRRLDGIVDPHDLVRLDDGSWLIVASAANSVFQVHADGRVERRWHGSDVHDSWHPNCLTVVGNELWMTAFGRFTTSGGWRDAAATGAGFLRNLTTGEEIGGLSQPHSPRRCGDEWWVCNSLLGTVVTRSDGDDQWRTRLEVDGYPRGLAILDGTAFVGVSARRDGCGSTAQLAIAEGSRIVDTVDLPCTEVYDVIAVAPRLVEALRRGFATNPQRLAEHRGHGLLSTSREPGIFDAVGEVVDARTARVAIEVHPPLPSRLAPAATTVLTVWVMNLGDQAVASVPPSPVFLSHRWIGDAGARSDGPRVRLGDLLLPGEARRFELAVRAPDANGRHRLAISLVQEGIAWFDDLTPTNGATFDIVVSDDEPIGGSGSPTAARDAVRSARLPVGEPLSAVRLLASR